MFDFAYSASGATMEVSTKGRGAAGKAALAASVEASTLSGLRKQACSIVRGPAALPSSRTNLRCLLTAALADCGHLHAESGA